MEIYFYFSFYHELVFPAPFVIIHLVPYRPSWFRPHLLVASLGMSLCPSWPVRDEDKTMGSFFLKGTCA